MANTKISALPAATTPIAGTALIPVVQSGQSRVAALSAIRDAPEPFVMNAQATSSVTASAADTIKMFARSYAGRVMPEFMGESGMDCFVQPALFNNSVVLWSPSSGATAPAGTMIGSLFTAGTFTHPTLASTNMQTAMRRTRFDTLAAANSTNGIRGNIAQVWRGNAANLGGFFAFFRFSQSLNVAATQSFVGLTSILTALAGEPSALTNMIGIGYNATDAIGTGWRLMMNDASGAATMVNLTGAPRDTATVLDLTLYCPPNSNGITVRVYNQSTQTLVLDNVTYTTDIPANTAFLNYFVQCRNVSSGAIMNIELARIYIESDV